VLASDSPVVGLQAVHCLRQGDDLRAAFHLHAAAEEPRQADPGADCATRPRSPGC
jgi:hypothetical protein